MARRWSLRFALAALVALLALIVAAVPAPAQTGGSPAPDDPSLEPVDAAAATPVTSARPGPSDPSPKSAQGRLSPRLTTLAQPAVGRGSDRAQSRAVGLPEEGPASLIRDGVGRLHVNVRLTDVAPGTLAGLEALGAEILATATELRLVTVAIDAGDLAGLGQHPAVEWAEEVLAPQVGQSEPDRTGPGDGAGATTSACAGGIVSEADTQLRVALARAAAGVDGSGVRIGVLSDSYDNLGGAAANVAAGELPGPGNPCGRTTPVTVRSDLGSGGSDEGRAMAQLVFDLAPGSPLSFATAFVSDVDFANQIRGLQADGASVIVDDISYFNEPIYQDGIIAAAIRDVTAAGATYFSSAGNSTITVGGRSVGSYETPAFRPTTCPTAVASLGLADCHDFDTGAGIDNGNTITIPNGGRVLLKLGYNQPERGITSDFDLALVDTVTGTRVASSTSDNLASQKAYELLSFQNTTGSARTYDLVVGRYGSGPVARFKTIFLDGDLTAVQFNQSVGGDIVGPTTYGHNNMTGAAAVAAAPYNNSAVIEGFSSRGPSTYCWGPVVGSTPAAPLPACVVEDIDITATDGAANSFFGQLISSTWRFYGTSAAAPHAAAVAALQRAAQPCRTPAEILAAQRASGRPVGSFGVDAAGAGLLDAVAAIDSLAPCVVAPGAPTDVVAVPGDRAATVTWRAPAPDPAAPVTAYRITPVADGVFGVATTVGPEVTTVTLTGLANGSTQRFEVVAAGSGGDSPATSSDLITVGAPLAPGFQQASPGSGSARVSWFPVGNNGAGISGYVVTPVVGETASAPIVFASTALSQTITGLTNGLIYTFRVAAVNARGTGPASVTAPITVGAPTTPAFPSVRPGDGSARVAWLASTPNGGPLTGHVITPVLDGEPQPPIMFSSTASAQVVPGLVNGATYTFRVVALNAIGASPPSTTAPVTVGTPMPPALPSANPGNGSARVSWFAAGANGAPITGYEITPIVDGSALAPRTFASAATAQTISGLTNGTEVTFSIRAINTRGTGPASTTAPVTIGAPGIPGFPGAKPGDGVATVSWWPASPNGSPILRHVVTPYVGATALPEQTFTGSGSSALVTGLQNGLTYTFKVRAESAIGAGPQSTTAKAVTAGAPAPPAFQSATPGDGTALVRWWPNVDHGSPITSYVITPHIGNVAQAPISHLSTVASLTVTGLTNGATYTFHVAAVNARGIGVASITAPITVGAPTAPSAVQATAGPGSATVTWAPAAANGSPITQQIVTPYRAGVALAPIAVASGATSVVVTGLTTGADHTFRVAAVNGRGAGPQSAASPSVRPTPLL